MSWNWQATIVISASALPTPGRQNWPIQPGVQRACTAPDGQFRAVFETLERNPCLDRDFVSSKLDVLAPSWVRSTKNTIAGPRQEELQRLETG